MSAFMDSRFRGNDSSIAKVNKRNIFLLIAFLLGGTLLTFNSVNLRAEEAPALQNQLISLDLKSVDIIELIRILSVKTAKTIVPSKNISGRITIFLNNVTLQDVLDIILVSQGLASDKRGDIIYIMTNAEYKTIYGKDSIEPRKMAVVRLNYAKPANVFNAISQLKSDIGKIVADEASGTIILIDIPEKLELLQKTIKEVDKSLETVVYDLNYAKPADAKTQLTAALTPGTGEVIIDERSGKAIVTDLPDKMKKIKSLIKELDEETRQVYIEADIVQVTLSDSFKRGIDWEKVFNESKLHGLDFVGYFPVSPALSSYQKISVGTVENDHYKTAIDFLKSYGSTEILSQPRIAVVNKEEANIMVGVRDAYVTGTLSQSESGTVTSEQIDFIDVGIKLKVVPTINKEGFIIMKIKPEVSSVRETITTTNNSRIPIVQTSEAETVLKVKDGTTIMLGGLLERTKTDSLAGVPGLSRIPVVGALFSTKTKENKKTELIVFITPHLIRGDSVKKGTEIEKFIPNQLMPDELRKQVIHKKLKEYEDSAKTTAPQEAVVNIKDLQAEVAAGAKDNQLQTISRKLYSPRTAAYYKKGLVFQETGNFNAAIKFYEKAIRADSRCSPAYNQLGIIYEAKGILDKAEENYLKALELDPEYLPIYSNLALLNESRNNTERAIHYWQQRVMLGEENDPWVKAGLKRIEQLKAVNP